MELELINKDFEKLLFPINNLSESNNPIEIFPSLEKWSEFTTCKLPLKKFNKIFRWIVLTYDKNSPFKKIPDVIQRKFEVAKYVKLFDKNTNIPDDLRKILLNENKEVNRMIIAYARMHRDSKYSLIVGLEHKFYEDLLLSQSGGTPNRQIEITQNNLENAITELFNQDNSLLLAKEFYEYMEEERLDNIRPEDIAKLLSEGKEPISEEEII